MTTGRSEGTQAPRAQLIKNIRIVRARARREKFKPFITKRGGVFRSKARKRLLGLSPGRLGWSESSSDFRYDIRSYVKQSFIDMELFIEVADSKDVNRIINTETIEPVVNTYFQLDLGHLAKLEMEKINLAKYLITAGFDYLSIPQAHDLAPYELDMISNAIALSRRLADRLTLEINEKQDGVAK